MVRHMVMIIIIIIISMMIVKCSQFSSFERITWPSAFFAVQKRVGACR